MNKWIAQINLNANIQTKLQLTIDRTVISAPVPEDCGRTVLTGCLLFTKIIWVFASLVDIFPPCGMQSRGALRQTTRLSVNWVEFDVTYIFLVVINCPGFSWASRHWLCVSRLDSQKNVLYIFICSVCYPLTLYKYLWRNIYLFQTRWVLKIGFRYIFGQLARW